MKSKHIIFPLIAAVFFIACESAKIENTATNANKTEINQNAGSGSVGDVSNNNSVNSTSKPKANSETNTDENADFEGTSGIIDKKYEIKSAALLTEIRTAGHKFYDRTVFEFEGAEIPGYHIEYIDKPVRACGSGNVVPLSGDGWLEIRFYPANAHTEEGKPTIKTRELAPDHQIIKQLKQTCDFEAVVTWVLGVSSPNQYRVLELKNPTRLAIDVKHK